MTFAQREAIHAGWDKPKDATLGAFFKVHPEWRDTPPVTSGFHWKWYYAFQHIGGLSVANPVRAYRRGLESRDAWTGRVGLVLPAVGVQTALHRIAGTDLAAQLDYQDRVRAFHERIRRFYYPYIFNETPFRAVDFAKAPAGRRATDQTSTSASRALSWMNSRRGSTRSPIRRVNMSSASSAWATRTCSRVRASASRVVSQSCSGFISPRPL